VDPQRLHRGDQRDPPAPPFRGKIRKEWGVRTYQPGFDMLKKRFTGDKD
jgi:hypothetical protein